MNAFSLLSGLLHNCLRKQVNVTVALSTNVTENRKKNSKSCTTQCNEPSVNYRPMSYQPNIVLSF